MVSAKPLAIRLGRNQPSSQTGTFVTYTDQFGGIIGGIVGGVVGGVGGVLLIVIVIIIIVIVVMVVWLKKVRCHS